MRALCGSRRIPHCASPGGSNPLPRAQVSCSHPTFDSRTTQKSKAEKGGYQGKGRHAGKLGALRLVRPTPGGGLVSYVCEPGRKLGQREPMYNGLRRGARHHPCLEPAPRSQRYPIESRCCTGEYPGAAGERASVSVLRRLQTAAADERGLRSPGVLGGWAVPLAQLWDKGADAAFLEACASSETASGTIFVHTASAARISELAAANKKKTEGSVKRETKLLKGLAREFVIAHPRDE